MQLWIRWFAHHLSGTLDELDLSLMGWAAGITGKVDIFWSVHEEMHKFYMEESSLSIPMMMDQSVPVVNTIKADVLLRLEKDITTEASHEVLEKEKSRKSSSTDELFDTEKGQGEKKSALQFSQVDVLFRKKSYATILAKPRLPTKTESSSAARAKPSVASKNIAKTIIVKNLPQHNTRRYTGPTAGYEIWKCQAQETSRFRTFGDGYRYAFMQFNSQKAAQLAVEAGFIQFDEWEWHLLAV
ncbi:hypothetical protein Tco_0412802 [Tanacetum coccineum]